MPITRSWQREQDIAARAITPIDFHLAVNAILNTRNPHREPTTDDERRAIDAAYRAGRSPMQCVAQLVTVPEPAGAR